MRRPLTLLLGAFALSAAGCGSDDGDKGDGVLTKPTGSGGSGQVVEMKDIQFRPKLVTVQEGETVTWVNEDTAPHNVVAKGADAPKSKLLQKGERFSFTPKTVGEIAYVCTVHPGMDGTLKVVGS